MIKFDCETCFQEYKVRDDRAGQTLKCKSCGSRMRVPSAGDDEDFEEEYIDPVRPRRKKNAGPSKQKSKSKSGSNTPLIAIAAGVGLVVIIGLGFLLLKGKDPGQNNVAGNGDAGNAGAANSGANAATSGAWVSLVDPPRIATDWAADPQLSIDLEDQDENFVTPYIHSPFIGLKAEGQKFPLISVWNLATGQKVNAVKIELPDKEHFYDLATQLSPDGKYLLTTAKERETKIAKLAVFDVSTGKLFSEWEAGTAGANVNGFQFSGTSTVIYKTLKKENNSFTSILKSWDFKSGKLIKEVLLNSNSNDFNTYNYQITPGGKYLISVSFQTITVYDLSSLELVKKLELIEPLKAADPGNIVSTSLSVTDKAISDDGKELALLMQDLNGTSLWTLNLKDGSVVNELFFPGDLYDAFSSPGYSGSKLTWSPDGSGWLLYGAIFVDRQRKQTTWALKPVPNVISRAKVILTGDSLVTQTASAMRDADGNTLYDRKPFLVSVPFPREEI
ncbi:MAG: hypothetical protein KDA70_16140, partial [Planctomycetaceae bacterium]|nr:hypothetical protein [Planctomycetaceae bacterium]